MKILINEKQVQRLAKGLHSGWKEIDGKLIRIYDFPTYEDTMDFVNKVAEIAKKQNHHPEMVIGFDTVKVIMFDHEKGKISEKCHKFTKAVDDMMGGDEELDERARTLANTRKKRLFPKSAIMANPARFKKYDRDLKGISLNEHNDNNILYHLKSELASAAQKVYDEWEQNDEGYCDHLGYGGICQDIASAMCEVLSENNIECAEISQQVGEQHVYAVAKIDEGVFEVDIPPYIYETGGGYCWRKIPDVTITQQDVRIRLLSDDPNEFENFIDF